MLQEKLKSLSVEDKKRLAQKLNVTVRTIFISMFF
jgi:hypothetical protein